MIRPAALLVPGLLACSHPTRPSAPAATHAVAPAHAAVAAAPRPAAHPGEEEEGEEVMNPVEAMSPYPSTPAGARALVTAMAHEAIHHDADGLARAIDHLDADTTRYELALTEEGSAAALRGALATVAATRAALVQQLAALREPLTVTVASAAGGDLADGTPHGLDPRTVAIRSTLRPLVRFYRVEVFGAADSGHVVVEPLAYLGGRWTFLGNLYTPVVPGIPARPAGPGVTAAR